MSTPRPSKAVYRYRECDQCHRTYYRGNRVRLWVITNPGHRLGWQKVEQKLCCACASGETAQRLLHEINPYFVPLKLINKKVRIVK